MKPSNIAIILLLLALLSMAIFVFGEAQNEYMTVKPFVASLVTGPNQLKIQTIDFTRGYNVTSSRWDNVTLGIFNAGLTNTTDAKAYVELFNVNSTLIATGNRVIDPIRAGATLQVNVSLVWNQNKTIADYAFGKVTAT